MGRLDLPNRGNPYLLKGGLSGGFRHPYQGPFKRTFVPPVYATFILNAFLQANALHTYKFSIARTQSSYPHSTNNPPSISKQKYSSCFNRNSVVLNPLSNFLSVSVLILSKERFNYKRFFTKKERNHFHFNQTKKEEHDDSYILRFKKVFSELDL